MTGPKILCLDIETKPLVVYAWALHDQYISEEDIIEDWNIMSFAAKWVGSKTPVIQMDRRNSKCDKKLVKALWKLLNEADIILGQNSKQFDVKKINARFYKHKLTPPSSYRQIDTKQLSKKNFGFTSNGLAYLSKMNSTYQKLTHKKFPGKLLWRECLAGNKAAWNEMAEYNIHDVLATEETYKQLVPWGTGINFNVYGEPFSEHCACGGKEFVRNGHTYSSLGKYQRYRCETCGAEKKTSMNLITADRRKQMLR